MPKYAHIKDGAIWRWLELDDPPPSHKVGYLRLIVFDAQPNYDPLTQTATPTEDIEPTEVVNRWIVTERLLVDVQARLSADINREAGERIIALTGGGDLMGSLVKQSNAHMRASELQEIRIEGGTLSADEQAEVAALKALGVAVKGVRAASNVTNGAIAATSTTSEARAAHDAVVWP